MFQVPFASVVMIISLFGIILQGTFAKEPWNLQSVDMSCQFQGDPICCDLVDSNNQNHFKPYSRHPHADHHHHHHHQQQPQQQHQPQQQYQHQFQQENHQNCKITKEYLPSPYETENLAQSEKIAKQPNATIRFEMIRDFVIKDYENATKWLDRVHIHMKDWKHHFSHNKQRIIRQEDDYYLSKFKISRHCQRDDPPEEITTVWYELIEPLTIYARDPRGFITTILIGPDPQLVEHSQFTIPSYGREYTEIRDYLLLPTLTDLSFTHRGEASTCNKRYLFDAGSKTFDSSVSWFLCGFLQNGITFDQVFAWEYTKYDPEEYWKKVPPQIVPHLHFYNAPVSKEYEAAHSILRIVDEIFEEDDYVVFKLDIDTPEIELPVALQILRDPKYASKIDEFFFELHFRCEVLSVCCWRYAGIPFEYDGLQIDRNGTLHFFQQLRYSGMRAHIWP